MKRNMRGDEARKKCPDLQLVQVPTAWGKADLTIYRDAGAEVVEVLQSSKHLVGDVTRSCHGYNILVLDECETGENAVYRK
mgnify:CR=1 FL=1